MKDKRKKIYNLLLIGDLVIICIIYTILFSIYLYAESVKITFFLLTAFFFILSTSLFFYYRYCKNKDNYSHQKVISYANDIKIILKAILIQFCIFLLMIFLGKDFYQSPGRITLSFIISYFFLVVFRIIVRRYQLSLRKRGYDLDNLILIGDKKLTKIIKNRIISDYRYGYKILNIFSDDVLFNNEEIISEFIKSHNVQDVILTNPSKTLKKYINFINELKNRNVNAFIVPDMFDIVTSVSIPFKLNDVTLLKIIDTPQKGLHFFFKRTFDFIVSILLIILLLPFFIVISVFIFIDSPGNIIYSQIRVGKNGKKFKFYKFRSMIADADKLLNDLKKYNEVAGPIFKMKDDPRVTTFGKFMRKFSIDEFPQLFNVLKGDMSLVGPRPPIPEEVEKYQEWHKRRFSVIPGITGLWQIRGRSDLDFDDMVKLDIYYIENWTLGLDFYILLRTIPIVLSARGSY